MVWVQVAVMQRTAVSYQLSAKTESKELHMISLALLGRTPSSNPDAILAKATFSGNCGVQGVGDALDLTPVSGSNSNGSTDPGGIGGPYPNTPLKIVPVVESEDLGGNYVQAHLGTTLQNCTLRAFAPGGGELASGSAYPAAMTAGSVLLKIYLPQEQA